MSDYNPNEHDIEEDEKPVFYEAEMTESMGNLPIEEDVAMKLAEDGMQKNPLAMAALRAQKRAEKMKQLRGKVMKDPEKSLPDAPPPKQPKTPDLGDL